MDRVAIGSGNPVLGTRKWYYFTYVQDDFKVTPDLTLNLGLRYEYYGVNREVNDRYRVFDLSRAAVSARMGLPGISRTATTSIRASALPGRPRRCGARP